MTLPSELMIQRINEESLLQIAEEYKGDGAFYFVNEADAKCRLYSIIQNKLSDSELLHSEWWVYRPRGRYDLVVWRPSKKLMAAKCWGNNHKEITEKVSNLILAAIEIDCLYGGSGKAKYFTTNSKIESNPDIQKLKNNTGKQFPYGYFLLLCDDEAFEKYSHEVDRIKRKFGKMFEECGIRSICVSRENKNILFKHGFARS